MANQKISEMTDLGHAPAALDYFPIVENASTENFRISIADFLASSGDEELLRNSGGTIGGVANAKSSDGLDVVFFSTGLRTVNGVYDQNGKLFVGVTATASAVNYLNVTNSATGSAVVTGAAGSDTNIQLTISSKGSGNLQLNAGSSGEVRFGGGGISATLRDSGTGFTQFKFGKEAEIGFSNDFNPNSGSFTMKILAGLGGGTDENGILRAAANSNGLGAFLGGKRSVVQTSNLALTNTHSGSLYTNEGATANINFTLPAAAGFNPACMLYYFYVQDADGITVTAGAGDTIRIAGSVSAAAGNISSTTVGSAVCLVSINATEWVALYSTGTWVVT